MLMINSIKKINLLLRKKQKKTLLYLCFLLIIGMFLEVFGLGLIVPLLTLILDPEIVTNSYYSIYIKEYFGDIDHKQFLSSALVILLVVYFIKTFFLIFLAFKQNTFLSNLYAEISVKLFNHYLNQSYIFHTRKNSATFIKNILVEVDLFRSYCTSLISLFIEFALLFSIIITLIYIEPFGAITIGLFFTFFSSLVIRLTKKNLKFWGKKKEILDDTISKNILESYGGIKEIIILGRIKLINKIFSKNNFFRARILRNFLTITQIPRFILEIVAILGIVGFIFLMMNQNKDSNELLTVLGVFVAATFRMIPSFNRIIFAVQNMKYKSSSVDLLFNEFKSFEQSEKTIKKYKEIKFENKIILKDIIFSYKKNNIILNNISLDINKGDCIGIIGTSGAGKSTFVNLITGLFSPSKGSIKVDGKDIKNYTRSWQNKIGYVPQDIFLADNTIQNNIAFGIEKEDICHRSIKKSIKNAQLDKFINSLDDGLNSQVGERGVQLSGGQIQRVGIARALYNNPEILILDEATASLDSQTEMNFMNSIKKLKGSMTILIISHRMSTLKDCNKIFKIQDKKLQVV